ncbi:MAG: hypothetical protein IKX40_10130 [Thermoguttaceae bacterium]|nr:hypothetical protein [Thermoguttaceae bacterium]
MSTSDSNYDELNSANEFDDANADAGYQADAEIADESAYTGESSADAGEYVDAGDYTESTEYADSSEYADADSSEYSEDAYAPLEGADQYSDGAYQSDEPVEEERQEVYFPPVMNRYNVILLLSLLILITGIVLVLIRLADYKFNVKAKQTDSGFASVERIVPMSDAVTSVFKNV